LQKSTGGAWPFTPGSEELLDNGNGSSSSARERWRRERASEAGSPVAKPRDRWRVPSKRRIARAIVLGAPVEGRRSGSGKPSSLTRGRWKRSWFLTKRPAKTGCLRGARQGASEVRSPALRVADNAKPEWDRRTGDLRHPHRAERRGGAVSESAEAGGVPSSMRPAGVGSPQGGSASHGRTRPSGRGRIPRSTQRELRARKSNDPTGARVVSRLQRSGRGIFSGRSRGAARQTEIRTE
jgi:hypothetical protein